MACFKKWDKSNIPSRTALLWATNFDAMMASDEAKVDQSKGNSVQEFSTDLLRVYYGKKKVRIASS